MLAKRPDVKAKMAEKGCHVMILGEHEEVCDLPEYAHICDTPENIVFGINAPEVSGVLPKMTIPPVAEKKMYWHCLATDMQERTS